MGKRKVFAKTDLGIPQIEHSHDKVGNVVILPEVIPPTNTTVEFGRNASSARSFDFAPWYGTGIDPITYVCQRQIERFLAGQEGDVATRTVVGYCLNGMHHFLDFCVLRATAFGRYLTLADVIRDLIDGYLGHLAGLGVGTISQRIMYTNTKSVLHALGRRGLIPLIDSGDMATFPRNPFPNSNRKVKGETSLGYAMDDGWGQHFDLELYADIQTELEDIKLGVVDSWLGDNHLAGGYGRTLKQWQREPQNLLLFKNHASMLRSIAESTAIRSNGHAWCTADNDRCLGNTLERSRCGDCNNAVIGSGHTAIYRRLYDDLKGLLLCPDIGEGGRQRVERDLKRCRDVLMQLDVDPESLIA